MASGREVKAAPMGCCPTRSKEVTSVMLRKGLLCLSLQFPNTPRLLFPDINSWSVPRKRQGAIWPRCRFIYIPVRPGSGLWLNSEAVGAFLSASVFAVQFTQRFQLIVAVGASGELLIHFKNESKSKMFKSCFRYL